MAFIVTPAEAAPTGSCPKQEAAIAKAGLPVKWASQVMWRESRCQIRAVSKPNSDGSRDYGAMQINSSWVSVTQAVCKTTNHRKALLKLRCNLAVAFYLYQNGGKAHWQINSGK